MIKRISMVVVLILGFIIISSTFNVTLAGVPAVLDRSYYYDEQSYQVITNYRQYGSIIYSCAIEKLCIGDLNKLVWNWTSKGRLEGPFGSSFGVLQVYRVVAKEGKYFAQAILRYEGAMSRTAPSTEGKIATVKLEDGSIIKGSFSGYTCNGSRTWPNGDVFTGYMTGVNLDRGTMKYANGDVYVGAWGFHSEREISGEAGRSGIVYLGDAYTGEWSFSEKYYHGKGKLTFKDGTVQEGRFLDGAFMGL